MLTSFSYFPYAKKWTKPKCTKSSQRLTSKQKRIMLKRSGLGSDFSAEPYLPAMPLPHPLHMWSHPLFQSFAQTAMPQYPLHTHEQEIAGQQSGTQTSPSDKFDSPERPGPSVDAGRPSSQSASSDPNYEDSHVGGARVPYSFPGGFVCPTPYPGQLDPLMLWMHQMQRQMAYLYSTSGSRNGYQHPTPTSSNGVNQRGFIKIPSGMPQKHSRLWETQSTENVQLWATVMQLSATVARAEVEILCQRGKISKLEDDLQLMKGRQDAMSEALKGKTVASQPKRVMRKRTATSPIAILGLPAYQPLSEKPSAKKARGLISESDIIKLSNPAVEGSSEETQLDGTLECTNRSTQDATGHSSSLTAALDVKVRQSDVLSKDNVEDEHAEYDNSSVVEMVAREESQDRHIVGIVPLEMAKVTSSPQNVEIKQVCRTELRYDLGRCNEDAVNESMAKQAMRFGHCDRDSKMIKMGEPLILEDRAFQAASNACSMAKQALRSGDCDRDIEMMKTGKRCAMEDRDIEMMKTGKPCATENRDIEMMKTGKPCVPEDRALQAASTEFSMKGESIDMIREDNRLEGVGKGFIEEGLRHAESGSESHKAITFGNDVLCTSENLEMMASEEHTEESMNINGATPHVVTVTKMNDYLVLYPETPHFKGPSI